MKRRVAIVGLDGVPPELLFDRLLPELPTMRMLISRGVYGPLESCDPPITVPAWAVMMTGKTPSQLGVFGFRERVRASYTDISLVTSASIKAHALWDYAGQHGKRSCVFGVPPAYPPKPIHGIMVGCHLTPHPGSRFVSPDALQEELEQHAGPYIPDVAFRAAERERVLSQLVEMTVQHARMRRHLLTKERWDFFVGVEIGTDRLHHAFWKFSDPTHPRYAAPSRFATAMLEYYRLIDQQLQETLSLLDDDTLLLILSDHGAKSMHGVFCVNEWLIERGYLVLRRASERPMPLEQADVDWAQTIAWAWGGYYARLFLNIRGREPDGCLAPQDAERIKNRLLQELAAVITPLGRPLGVTTIQVEPGQAAADLMLYFGNLSWRAAGTIGHGRLFLEENDTGPDDAVHSKQGVFLLYDPRRTWGDRLTDPLQLTDIAPTILRLLDLSIPDGMAGTPLAVYA